MLSICHAVLLDGVGTCLGGFLDAPFSTTVYLGHPAYRQMGGRTGYATLTGLLWGSILALLIDHDLRKATAFSFVAFVLSAVGLIHAETIGLSLSPVTIGYLVLTLLLGLAAVIQSRQRSQEPATEP